jgi:hypothetical protein
MQAKGVIRFTEAEARRKLGHQVRSLIEFAGVPRGTMGTVVEVHQFQNDSFDVVVKWDLPRGERLEDRFAKGPYEEFLFEETDELAYAVV